jgi:urea transport system substrate-binding protein
MAIGHFERAYKKIAISSIIILLLGLIVYTKKSLNLKQDDFIKIGIIHSRSGNNAIDELPMIDAMLLTINDINEAGGVLGKLIDPIVADGDSDPVIFEKEANRLIKEHNIKALFGCWTSDCRRAVEKVSDAHSIPFFFSVPFEGTQQSKSTFYLGMTPHQQIHPAMGFTAEKIGKTISIIGLPNNGMNNIIEYINKNLSLYKLEIIDNFAIRINKDIIACVEKMSKNKPQCIFNFLHGSINKDFLDQVANKEDFHQIPCINFNLTEEFAITLKNRSSLNLFTVWPFIESDMTPEGEAYVKNFRKAFGEYRIVSSPMVTSSTALMFWKKAAEKAKSFELKALKKAFGGEGLLSASGPITIDTESLFPWQIIQIAHLETNGKLKSFYKSHKWVDPLDQQDHEIIN